MARLAIELTPTHVRAVRRDWRGALRTAEVPWTPDDAAPAVEALKGLGNVSSVRLAVSPLLLRVKELQLPNVAAREQWRAIALQPGRYFAEPVSGDALSIAWHAPASLAFAIEAGRLDRWMRAFASLGPVTMVVPAALAVARSGISDGTYQLAAAGDTVAVATVSQGRLTQTRVTRHAASGVLALPAHNGLGGEWRAALGAVLARGVEDWESLTTTTSQRALRSRRLRGLAAEATACVLALVVSLAALDNSRASYESRLDRAIAAAESDAQPGLALRRRLAGLEHEGQLLRGGNGGLDGLATLAALSEVLPRAAVVTRLRMTGDEWQVSGRARGGQAAAIVPALERDGRFTDVRMTSASTHFREDAQEFESFSVSFRVRPSD